VDSTETYISLYAGGGGLDMGFQRAHGNARCVAVVEHEASAVGLLVDHIEAELLDAAPVYTDAFTFPAERFHGLVDWVIGGPPCQPFSVAGKQLGADDPRNLWPLTLRMVGQIQPGGCFFENVPSAESLWYIYEEVIPGLRYLGYEVKVGIFSATEVGAPHNRERVFILADTIGQRGRGGNSEWQDATHAFPPGPNGDWSNVPERLWPAVKPGFRDVADGLAGRVAALSRAQELRILGNGVVPATAEKAFRTLEEQA
jgi:DNA (cytosine-5)-methyltransferase 1